MNPPDHHQNILELYRQGWTQTAIAKALGFTRRTVYNHIHELVFVPGKARGRPRGSRKLLAFKAQILSCLELQPDLSMNRLLADLRSQGYQGGLSILRDFCRSLKLESLIQAPSLSLNQTVFPRNTETRTHVTELEPVPLAFFPNQLEVASTVHSPQIGT